MVLPGMPRHRRRPLAQEFWIASYKLRAARRYPVDPAGRGPAAIEVELPMRIRDSSGSNPRLVLFGTLRDGRFVAARMHEDQVPYTNYWGDEGVDQKMVYIDPDDSQLEQILLALQDGRLDYQRIQEWGGRDGGTTELAF